MKRQKQNEDFPFLKDKGHIYNQLIDRGIKGIDLGWAKMEFELVGNLKQDNVECDGVTHFNKNQIHFDIALDDDTARETIMHEIMHCILETIGLDEKNYNQEFVTTTNEVLALGISKQLIVLNNLNLGLFGVLYGNN